MDLNKNKQSKKKNNLLCDCFYFGHTITLRLLSLCKGVITVLLQCSYNLINTLYEYHYRVLSCKLRVSKVVCIVIHFAKYCNPCNSCNPSAK